MRQRQDPEAARHRGTSLGCHGVGTRPASGRQLWIPRVDIVADRLAGDVASRATFRRMDWVAGCDVLEIENEAGGVLRIDVEARASIWLSGPGSALR